jgi:hypothetical protein
VSPTSRKVYHYARSSRHLLDLPQQSLSSSVLSPRTNIGLVGHFQFLHRMASTTSYSTDSASGHAAHPTTALLQAQEDSDLGVQAPIVSADGGPSDPVSLPFSEQSKTIQGGPANSAPGIRSFVCARCRSKHLKCDGAMPCSRCKEDSGECFYTMSRRGWKGPRKRKAEPNNDSRSVSYGMFTRGV